MKKIALLFTVIFISLSAIAEIRLPSIFGDHMVLQQKSLIKIWGWADVGEKITLQADWDTTVFITKGSSNAQWSLQIKTPIAGGLHKIIINGRNKIIIDDILIGEVWLCGGQSNMEMSAGWAGLKQFEPDVASANNKSIRLFHVPRTTSPYPQDDVRAKWVVCNPADMRQFSLIGYFFGQKINQELNVPVGLIGSNWGGTPAEVWTPEEAIASDEELNKAASEQKETPWGPVSSGYAYNAMIYPLINFKIAGALWYQGEANVQGANTYHNLFSTMIKAWRKAWDNEFPFYFVQIAPYAGYGKTNDSSSLIREAQTQTLSLPHTGMVVITDLVNDINNIHPQLKKEVAHRLANYALAETYNKNISGYKSPEYAGMKVEKNKIRISFKNVEKGLMLKGNTLTEFYISGENKKFMPANAKIEGNTVVVWNNEINNPAAVRFGFTNDATPNLFSKEGLPVNGFRTDDWNISTVTE